jgi:DNA (cytosine-5)-methyltransferase 1
MKKLMLNKPSVVSLFCGAGGIDLGLTQAGLDIIWANDNNSDSIETYKVNFKAHEVILDDITNVKSESIPEADIVVGGFPCQGFSMANKFRHVDDSRNTLYLEMLRVIRDKKPKWFIAENVRGILSIGKGAVIKKILQDFEDAGYSVRYQLVNMADHGVPQMRKRVLILGTRKDLMPMYELTHPEPTHSMEGSLISQKWVSINDALRELEKIKDIHDKDIGSKYKLEIRDFSGHRMTDGNKPSPTILARGNGKGGVNATPHPNGERRLTVRESAWIQTFPANFVFIGSSSSRYRQIGNAVPVLYGKKLGEKVMEVYKLFINAKINNTAHYENEQQFSKI